MQVPVGAGRARAARARRGRRPGRHGPARRRRPPPAPGLRRPAGPRALARPDRQRPDRRDGRALGAGRASIASSAGSSASSGAARRPSSAASTRPRPASRSRTRRPTRRSPAARSRSSRPSSSPTRSTTCRASGPCSSCDPATRPCAGSVPGRTRPTRTASAAASIGTLGLDASADQYVPYIRPQENGGHADVRWLEVTRAPSEPTGIRIELDEPRQVSVTHLRAADLAAATHDVDVVPVAETIVHLDAAHRGLGTASCGPDTLPEYRLGPGTYRWALDHPRPAAVLTDADRLVARDPRAPPPQRADQLRHAGPRQRHARPPPFRGARCDPDRSHAHLEPTGFAGFTNRIGDPVPLEYPTTGHRRLPHPGPDRRTRRRLDRPRSRLPRAPDPPRQTATAGGRRPARRPTSSPTARPTRSRSSSPTPRAAYGSSSATRSSATRRSSPAAPGSTTTARPRSA